MELKLFTDLIDALGKVAGGLKAIVNLPKPEREAMRKMLDETYRLIDTTLNMVIIRLGDILLLAVDDFLREAARLDIYNEWMQAEREFRRAAAYAWPCAKRRRWPENWPAPSAPRTGTPCCDKCTPSWPPKAKWRRSSVSSSSKRSLGEA